MRRSLAAALALGALLALWPRPGHGAQEEIAPAAEEQSLAVVPDLNADLPVEQVSGLQNSLVKGIDAHLNQMASFLPPKSHSIESKALSNYLARQEKTTGPNALSSSVLIESLADPDLARRMVKALGATPEQKAVMERLAGIAGHLHATDAPGWKAKLQRLQTLRRQKFSNAGDSKATASYLLGLFDGVSAGLLQEAPVEQAPTMPSPATVFKVSISPAANRDLSHIPKNQDLDRIETGILSLEQNPRPYGVKKLSGQNSVHRIRVGHWRVIYDINDATGAATILNVLRRSKDTYSAF